MGWLLRAIQKPQECLGLRDLCTLSRVGSSDELSMHLLTDKQHSGYLAHVGTRALYGPGGLGGSPAPL